MKFKNKIIIIILLSSIIPIIIFGIFISFYYESQSLNLVLKLLANVASLEEQRINTELLIYKESLEKIVNNYDFHSLILKESSQATNEKLNEIISNEKQKNININSILLIKSSGEFVAGSDKNFINNIGLLNKSSGFLILNLSGNNYLVYSQNIDYDASENKKLIYIINPSVINSIINYTAGYGKSYETVIAREIDNNNAIYLTALIDKNGEVIKSNIVKQVDNLDMTRAMKQIETTFLDTIDYKNTQVYSAVRYIDIANWGLVVKVDKEEITNIIDIFHKVTLLTVLILSLLTYIIARIISSKITKPIEMLSIITKKISEGDIMQQIEVTQKDEIGDLSKNFNLMTLKLSEYYKDLENKVNIRTKELNDKLKELHIINEYMIDREIKMVQLKKQIKHFEDIISKMT